MKINMGLIDRTARILIGAALVYLGVINTDIILNNVIRYCLLGFGIMNLMTAILGFCPMYTLANITTLKKSDN